MTISIDIFGNTHTLKTNPTRPADWSDGTKGDSWQVSGWSWDPPVIRSMTVTALREQELADIDAYGGVTVVFTATGTFPSQAVVDAGGTADRVGSLSGVHYTSGEKRTLGPSEHAFATLFWLGGVADTTAYDPSAPRVGC